MFVITDLLCQHISSAQWQVSVPQLLPNSPIRWAAGVSSGCHHGLLWVETAVSVHWGATTVPASMLEQLILCFIFYSCSLNKYSTDCTHQLYQYLKNIQLETPNITRVKSYCFGGRQLQNYSIHAEDSAFVFVSYSKRNSSCVCVYNSFIACIYRMKNYTFFSLMPAHEQQPLFCALWELALEKS